MLKIAKRVEWGEKRVKNHCRYRSYKYLEISARKDADNIYDVEYIQC